MIADPDGLVELTRRLANTIDEAWSRPSAAQRRELRFQAGDRDWTLPLEALAEVAMPPARWSRAPLSPPEVLGVMNLRGRVVAVIDLTRTLGMGRSRAPLEPRVLVVSFGRRELGLWVDAVLGIGPATDADRLELEPLLARFAGKR